MIKEKKVFVFWSDEAKGFIKVSAVNGVLQKIYLIISPVAKQYAGFRLILKDLKNIKECISELKKLTNDNSSIVKQSLSFYAVITYGKCFAGAEERGTQLNKKEVLKVADNECKTEHDQIIELRNTYVAHSSHHGYEHNPIVVALNPDLSNKEIIGIYDNIQSLIDTDSQLDNFEKLVDIVTNYVEQKCRQLLDKIDTNLKEQDINSLYEEALDIPPIDEFIEIKAISK